MLEKYPDVLKPADVSMILRISMKRTYALLRCGDIKSRKIGRKYIISKDSLINYISES